MLTKKTTSDKATAATATLVSLVSAEGENGKEGWKRADAGKEGGERKTQLFHPLLRRYSAPPSSPDARAWWMAGCLAGRWSDLFRPQSEVAVARIFPSPALSLSLLGGNLFAGSFAASFDTAPRLAPSGGRPLWRAKLLKLRFHLARVGETDS